MASYERNYFESSLIPGNGAQLSPPILPEIENTEWVGKILLLKICPVTVTEIDPDEVALNALLNFRQS